MKQFLALGDAFSRCRHLSPVIDRLAGLFFKLGEGLEVGDQVPAVLLDFQDIFPGWHIGSRHAIGNHPEDIGVVGEVFVKRRGLDFVQAGGEITWWRDQQIACGAIALPFLAVAPDTAFHVDFFTVFDVAGGRRRWAAGEDARA